MNTLSNSLHIAVLQNEVISYMNFSDKIYNIKKESYIIDCTCGFGTHSLLLLKNTSSNIKLICNDKDKEALDFCKEHLKEYQDRIIFSNNSFSNVLNKYKDKNIIGILADIGVSSYQLDNDKRGFGFNSKTLDMRMDQTSFLDAKHIINTYTKDNLEAIFLKYDVKDYKKMSALICDNRPFNEARELAGLIEKHSFRHKKHSATLVFQAIRIEVNKELEELEELLISIQSQYAKFMQNKCKVCIISFHSLEDKIIKTYFRNWSKNCICTEDIFKCECGNNNQKGIILTKKPITPTQEEIQKNPRSSSSKMRVFAFGVNKFDKNKYKKAKS